MNIDDIHIGRMIAQVLKQQGRKHVWLAQQINTDPSNIAKIMRKRHLDTELLLRISAALEHDFFAAISEQLQNQAKTG